VNANVRFIIVASLLLSAGGARAASSVTGLEGELLESDEVQKSRLSGQVTLATAVGQGTFISNKFADDPYIGQSLQASVAYNLKGILPIASNLILAQGLGLEYTEPDVTTGRRVDWSDTSLSLALPRLFKEKLTGISFGGSIGSSLPISYQSITYRKITSLSVGLNATRQLYGFTFIGGISAAHTFYGRDFSGLTAGQVSGTDHPYATCSAYLGNSEFCTGGYGTVAWSGLASLVATYDFTEKLQGGLQFRWQPAWRRMPATDQFTTTKVNPSSRAGDRSTGAIFAGYQLDDRFSLTALMATSGPTHTADGNGFRFPFFDTISPYNNITSYEIDVTGSF
jgi:hypothetical protein